MGIEPTTSPLPRECSTTELREPATIGPPPVARGHSAVPQYPHGESNPGFRAENATS